MLCGYRAGGLGAEAPIRRPQIRQAPPSVTGHLADRIGCCTRTGARPVVSLITSSLSTRRACVRHRPVRSSRSSASLGSVKCSRRLEQNRSRPPPAFTGHTRSRWRRFATDRTSKWRQPRLQRDVNSVDAISEPRGLILVPCVQSGPSLDPTADPQGRAYGPRRSPSPPRFPLWL